MSDDLKRLIEAARTRTISPDELQAQRRSFAYGNTKIENERVTREMVDAQDEILKSEASDILMSDAKRYRRTYGY